MKYNIENKLSEGIITLEGIDRELENSHMSDYYCRSVFELRISHKTVGS